MQAHHEADGEGVEGASSGVIQALCLRPELHQTQQLPKAGVEVPEHPDDGGLEDGACAAHGHIAVLSCPAQHRVSQLHVFAVVTAAIIFSLSSCLL